MRLTFDPAKRAKTLAERGLDFLDAEFVFAGVTVEVEGHAQRLWRNPHHLLRPSPRTLVVVGYVPRGASRHIFSMRKANAREQERLAPYLEI
jgi:uncharacterized DUF497 family protein